MPALFLSIGIGLPKLTKEEKTIIIIVIYR